MRRVSVCVEGIYSETEGESRCLKETVALKPMCYSLLGHWHGDSDLLNYEKHSDATGQTHTHKLQ